MTAKLEINKKMLGKPVSVQGDKVWEGIIEEAVDEETFLVKDVDTFEMRQVSIFDIRSTG